MYKKVFSNVSLQVVMQQQPEVFNQNICFTGVLSKHPEGYKFEESVKQKRPRRNPKLYEGQYVSLVHRSDDRYACTLKYIRPKDENFDPLEVAFRMYLELNDALQIIG